MNCVHCGEKIYWSVVWKMWFHTESLERKCVGYPARRAEPNS